MPVLSTARRPRGRAVPAADRIGCQLMRVARRWRQAVDTELESYGLSHATWRPLLKLAGAAEPLRQHELADLLQIGHPELVRLIDSLERKRLVVRHDDGDDRRVKRIALTAGGRRLAEQVEASIEAFERRVLQGIATADRARCRDVFARIEERLDSFEPTTRPRKQPRIP
jgi:MarR family transcriptional regulator, transcriptional regulator for hemolysin